MSDKPFDFDAASVARTGMTIAELGEEITVNITRGDLWRLDRIISFMETMAALFDTNFADDLWNLRNHMIPFKPGDLHYDARLAEGDDG